MKTAIIIGAGPAGLTAAYKLLTETDIKPIILEENERDRRHIANRVVHNGNRMDIGGHRFFSQKQTRYMDFWKQHHAHPGRARIRRQNTRQGKAA